VTDLRPASLGVECFGLRMFRMHGMDRDGENEVRPKQLSVREEGTISCA